MEVKELRNQKHGASWGYAPALAAFSALVGVLVLLGWIFNLTLLKSIVPGWPAVHAGTGLGLLLCGAALILLTSKQRRAEILSEVFAVLTLVLGVIGLIQFLAGNGVLQSASLNGSFYSSLLSMAPASAFNLVLLGTAVLLLRRKRWDSFSSVLVHIAAGTALIRIFVAPFGVFSDAGSDAMSFGATVGFLPLCAAILLASPKPGVVGILTSPDLGGRLARILIPVALLVPMATTLLRLRSERAGLIDSDLSAALVSTVNAVVITSVVLWAAWLLGKADRQRKAHESALRASEAKLRRVVDSPMIGIFYWSLDGSIGDANEKFLGMLGYTAKDLQAGKLSWAEITPREYDAVEAQKLAEVVRNHSIEPYEKEFIKADGQRLPVLIGAAMMDEQSRDGVAFVLDISEQRDARCTIELRNAELLGMQRELLAKNTELALSNAELDSFSYSVSHDLRAPLRAVEGFSKALEEDYGPKLDVEARRYIGRIRAATLRMAQLIDDLLALSRVSRADLKPAELDISALASSVAKQIEELEPDRQVEWNIEPGLKAQGDARLVRIVLENLLGNAWKFTSKLPQAKIEFGQENGGAPPSFYVKDDGSGFDMIYADKLFTAFQRLHRMDQFPGTGIGLATVRRIVTRHGGTVWAKAEPDKGAKISFTLNAKEQS